MTDKERLEEIIEKYSEITVLEYINDVEIVGVNMKDLVWLIEQAERVEWLERELQNEVRKKNEIAADWSKIFDERYKAQEALRFYADENNWNEIPIADNYVVSVLKNGDSGEVAREALGESE